MSLEVNQLIGFGVEPVSVAANPSVSFLTSSVSGSDLTTYTFSSLSLGTESSDRRIIVCIGHNQNPQRSVSSVTVGGVSATSVVTANAGSFSSVAIWIADVPTGTTGDVVVTLSAGVLQCGVAIFAATGLNSGTATATATDTAASSGVLTTTINVPAGGFAVAVALNSVPAVHTWSAGLTERSDDSIEGQVQLTSASDAFVSAQTGMTVTTTCGSGTNASMAVASWGN